MVGSHRRHQSSCARKMSFWKAFRLSWSPHPIGAEPATRDVFSLLAQAINSGEIADVINQLPAGIKELWPEGMRTWAAKRSVV